MTTYSVKEWRQHLETVGKRLEPKVIATMERAGFQIRDDWKRLASADNPVHATRYADAIIMRRTIVDSDGLVTVRVEPGSWGQGKLGYLLERGMGANRAQNNDATALANEVPNVEKWLGRIAKEAIEE